MCKQIRVRMNHLGWSAAMLLGALSCGSALGVDGAPGGLGGDPSTPDGFAEALRHARCEKTESCCERLGERFDDGECRSYAKGPNAVFSLLPAEKIQFHPEIARQCIDAVHAAVD